MTLQVENSPESIARLSSLPLPHQATVTRSLSFALLVPPSVFVVPRGWEWTHSAPFEGPSIIASLVKGLGYRFRLFDMREDFNPEAIRELTRGFDVVGISTFGDSFNYLRKSIEILKQENPERTVVLGGPLATSVPDLILESTQADFVVAGEGELTLMELLDRLSGDPRALPVNEILGLAWKDAQGQVHMNAARPQLKDLDILPFQDFSAWERFRGKPIPEIYLSYSRGCSHSCTFCYRAFPKLNTKSVARVRREIDYYKACGFQMAWWNDLTFVTDRDYVHQLMNEAFKDHRFRWTAFSRVTGLDKETLLLMKKNGLDIVLYGMESVSKSVLDSYRKGITRNAMIDTIELHRRCGVKIGGLFIVGAPDDDEQTMRELIEFCREFKEVTRVKYLSALPGTPFYRECLKTGLITDPVRHLEWLSEEQSIEEDIENEDFVLFARRLTKQRLKEVYRDINGTIERRPYDYRNPDNIFLEGGLRFERRKTSETK